MKNQKGITLVALVITVIVLLILAGTAITIAINGGDLFSRASDARTQWNASVDAENNAIDNVMTSFNTYYNQYVNNSN